METHWQIESKNHPNDEWFVLTQATGNQEFNNAMDIFNRMVKSNHGYELRLVEVTKKVFHHYDPKRGQ